MCKLSVVVAPLCGIDISLRSGAVSESLAIGSEQVSLQAAERCDVRACDSYWKNCVQCVCGNVQDTLCLGAVSECVSEGSDTNRQRPLVL